MQQFTPHHRPARCLFVTGTDTGVGKTRVASAIVAAWTRAGRRVAPLKPIETGCATVAGDFVAADGELLYRAARGRFPLALIAPLRFAAAASPAAAAELAGTSIDLSAMDRAYGTLLADAEAVVIEGAGGLLVPIAPKLLMADLALHFTAPLLIVARSSLGTVNHSLLTIEAARRRGLLIAGVVFNQQHSSPGIDEASNPRTVAALGQVPLLGTLPFHPGEPSFDELADMAERHLALGALWNFLSNGDAPSSI